MALRDAGENARGATAYVTLEPCSHHGRTPPCADALIAIGVKRVVCCIEDPFPKVSGEGIKRLRDAGIDVSVGGCAAEARALNVGYFSRFERARPWVRLKMAMSLDARTAPAGEGDRWISGEASRADVQHWRARSSAVLTGAGTIRSDDPQLNVRLAYGPWIRQPLRVVLDSSLSLDPEANVFRGGGALVFAADATPGGSLRVERVARTADGLDIAAVLARLAKLEMNEVLVECGAHLAGSFLASGLVDEIILYMAPHLLGENAAPLAYVKTAPSANQSTGAAKFQFLEAKRIGDDMRLMLVAK
jgi:diaminohydroxyphosphoribosylaminopyrimidine deaminase/5-amino-6-(5-phosphoribosylamino)uracil reductase